MEASNILLAEDAAEAELCDNDFHCRQREFQSFYDMSNLQEDDMQIQRTVLLNCLHQDFKTKISEVMTAVTDIKVGTDLIVQSLERGTLRLLGGTSCSALINSRMRSSLTRSPG